MIQTTSRRIISRLSIVAIFISSALTIMSYAAEDNPTRLTSGAWGTPKAKAIVAKFNKTFAPKLIKLNGTKNNTDAISKLEMIVRNKLGIKRYSHGRVAGPEFVYNGERGGPQLEKTGKIDFARDWLPVLIKVQEELLQAAEGRARERLSKLYVDLCTYIAMQGYGPDGDKDATWVGNGYWWRDRSRGVARHSLRCSSLLPADLRKRYCDAIMWFCDGGFLFKEEPYASMDMTHNTLSGAVSAIAAMPDGEFKWKRMLAIRSGFDRVLVHPKHISPDGGMIHHGGYHISYTYGYASCMHLLTKLERCGLGSPYTDAAMARAKRALFAWAWITQGEAILPCAQLRPTMPLLPKPDTPKNRAGGDRSGKGAAYIPVTLEWMATVTGGKMATVEPELSALYLAMGGGGQLATDIRAAGIKPKPLSGHHSLPVLGLSLHRRDNWLVALRGQNRFWRGGESYGWPKLPSAYEGDICWGSLFVIASGKKPNLFDSGYRAEGWNHSQYPGNTKAPSTEANTGAWKKPGYFGTSAKLGGGISLDGQGLWGFAPPDYRKSAFFVDDRITFTTSDIAKPQHKRTTIFRHAHDDMQSEPVLMTGDGKLSKQGEWQKKSVAGTWFIDPSGNAWVMHSAGHNLLLQRGEAKWRYALKNMLVNSEDEARHGEILKMGNHAEKLKLFKPTVADYSTLAILHGTDVNASLSYTLIVRGGEVDARRLAKSIASRKPEVKIHRNSGATHIYEDTSSGLWGFVFFEDDTTTDVANSPLIKCGRAGFILVKKQNGILKCRFASTDLSRSDDFSFVLKGRWSWQNEAPKNAELKLGDINTTLRYPYTNQLTEEVLLHQAN